MFRRGARPRRRTLLLEAGCPAPTVERDSEHRGRRTRRAEPNWPLRSFKNALAAGTMFHGFSDSLSEVTAEPNLRRRIFEDGCSATRGASQRALPRRRASQLPRESASRWVRRMHRGSSVLELALWINGNSNETLCGTRGCLAPTECARRLVCRRSTATNVTVVTGSTNTSSPPPAYCSPRYADDCATVTFVKAIAHIRRFARQANFRTESGHRSGPLARGTPLVFGPPRGGGFFLGWVFDLHTGQSPSGGPASRRLPECRPSLA